jgi:hypothetical protein
MKILSGLFFVPRRNVLWTFREGLETRLSEKWDGTHFARLIQLKSVRANKWTVPVRNFFKFS